MNRLDARFVKARDAGLAEPEHFAHLTLRQTIDVHQAQHLALLRVGKQLDRGSHRVFLEPVADGRERIPVEFVRSVVNSVRVASRQGSRFPIAVRFGQRAPEHSLLGLSGSLPEVHVRDLRVYCPKVAETRALHLPQIAPHRDLPVLRVMHPEGRPIVEPESRKSFENRSLVRDADCVWTRVDIADVKYASKRKKRAGSVRSLTARFDLVAGAGYAQRCPVEFGVRMEAVITA